MRLQTSPRTFEELTALYCMYRFLQTFLTFLVNVMPAFHDMTGLQPQTFESDASAVRVESVLEKDTRLSPQSVFFLIRPYPCIDKMFQQC